VEALFAEWWPVITAVALALVKVLNKLTPHFASKAGVVKALLIMVDLLDLIKTSSPPIEEQKKCDISS
jgi:hypothetical protein